MQGIPRDERCVSEFPPAFTHRSESPYVSLIQEKIGFWNGRGTWLSSKCTRWVWRDTCMQNENWGLQKRDANPDLPTLQWVLRLLCSVYGSSEGAPCCSCSCSVWYINLPPAAQTQRVSVLEPAFGLELAIFSKSKEGVELPKLTTALQLKGDGNVSRGS